MINVSKRHIEIELPAEVWEIIDTQFRSKDESDSEILSKIIKNHIDSTGYYPDADSLQHGNGLKEIVDILDDKVMSIIDLLEIKKLASFREWNEIMQNRIIKNTSPFN